MNKHLLLASVCCGLMMAGTVPVRAQLSAAVQLARQEAQQAAAAGGTHAPVAQKPAVAGQQSTTTTQPEKKITFQRWALQQSTGILNKLQKNGDFATAKNAMDRLCDQTIAYVRPSDIATLRQVDFARLLITQLSAVPGAQTRLALLKYLRKNHTLAKTLVFLVKSQKDAMPAIYAMLDHLRHKLGRQAAEYPNLTAAICSVLYTPLTLQINENQGHSPDPVALFKYYVRYQNHMFYGIRGVPAELLIYVVDGGSSIADMRWALAHYHGDANVGELFFSIRYDYGFLQGHKLRIDTAGFTLPNIKRYGGVCVDQAFFASEVAKAIGIPSAYDTAMGNDAGHAWVGFLESSGDQGWWNFLSGRYQEYRGIQGHVMNPQTRQQEPDTYISLSAQLIHTTARQRWNAEALTDAAGRLMLLQMHHHAFSPLRPPQNVNELRHVPRPATVKQMLTLLRRAVHQCNGYAPEWFMVSRLASQGQMSYDQKANWASALIRVCQSRYPDFIMAVLTPMILTVKNVKQQNQLWNREFMLFENTRFDLAGEVRMYQAAMWKKAGHLNRAGECYMDVINRFASAGPFVLGALAGAQNILEQQGHKNRVLKLWETTWLKIRPPSRVLGIFMKQSDWYRVGKILESKLVAANQINLAQKVQNQMHLVMTEGRAAAQ